MNIYDFMKLEKKEFLRPQIVCVDGVTLSVQASNGHYCIPREDDMRFYPHVEVGYPSIRPPQVWEQYFEGVWNDLGFFGTIWSMVKGLSDAWWAYRHCPLNWAKHKLESAFKDNATDSVYGYVPIDLVVDEFIEVHGGIDVEKTLKEKV